MKWVCIAIPRLSFGKHQTNRRILSKKSFQSVPPLVLYYHLCPPREFVFFQTWKALQQFSSVEWNFPR